MLFEFVKALGHPNCAKRSYNQANSPKGGGVEDADIAFPAQMSVQGTTEFRFKSDGSSTNTGFKLCEESGWRITNGKEHCQVVTLVTPHDPIGWLKA